jgi:hypothetical protein
MVSKAGFALTHKAGFSLKFSYVFLWSSLLGWLFGEHRYDFDTIFNMLKRPATSLRAQPLTTLNAYAALLYLMPALLPLMVWGLLSDRGEVARFTFRRTTIS